MKKIISLLLILVITISTVACGNNAASDSGTEDGNTVADDGEQAGENDATADASDLEPYNIVMAYVGDSYDDIEKISAAISEITEPVFNCTVELMTVSWAELNESFTLMLSGSEQLDLFPVSKGSTYVNNGYVIDLKDLLDKYGNNIKQYVGEDYMYYANVEGTIYGVPPAMKEWTSNLGIIFRKDILEEAGFKEEDIKTLDDVEKVYETVSEMYPNMTMLAGRQEDTPGNSFANVVDLMGSSQANAGVVLMDDTEGKVVNYYETDYFAENMSRMYKWAQNGWISKDCATITETRENQMKAGSAFSYFCPIKPDTVAEQSRSVGSEVAAAILSDNVLQTGNVTGMPWGIGRNCKYPERVMQVLDYMYGSSEIMNLLNWGIEGEHYVVVDEENGIINYPDGVTSDTKSWGLGLGWQIPNQKIAYIWEGTDPEIWEQYTSWNTTEAKGFISNGFIFNDSDVQTEIAALYNVYAQYMDALGSGAVDPTENIDKFNKDLYNAGLQTVMDAKQEQLDQFLGK